MATQIKGVKISRKKTGEAQASVRFHCTSIEDLLTGIPSTYRGLLLDGQDGDEWGAGEGEYVATANYSGVPEDQPDPEEFDTFDFEGAYREEPIETFPRLDLLTELYGGKLDTATGRFVFDKELPQKYAGRARRAGIEQNPMFGVTTYPVEFHVARQTMIRRRVPREAFEESGKIIERLPDGFDYDGDIVAWFVSPPKTSKRGNATQIVREFKGLPKELGYWSALRVLLQNG